MQNKYMRRGLAMLTSGILFNTAGWIIKTKSHEYYGWAMIIGTILFGIGFMLILYSLIRKVERQAILEERHGKAGKNG